MTGQLEAELMGHERAVRDLAFSPDGRALLSGSDDGTIRVWSVDGRSAIGVFYRQVEDPAKRNHHYFGLSRDGSALAIANETEVDGTPDVYLWNLGLDK